MCLDILTVLRVNEKKARVRVYKQVTGKKFEHVVVHFCMNTVIMISPSLQNDQLCTILSHMMQLILLTAVQTPHIQETSQHEVIDNSVG